MSHAIHSNAALTPQTRLKMARLIVDHDWDVARAAERYNVSWKTADKWAQRYLTEGPDEAAMLSRSPISTGPRRCLIVCVELGIKHNRTRPYRPQTNGKTERFHRTLAEGWAFKKFYSSENARLAALPGWLHQYNHHRPHSAIGKVPPITRLDNLAGHHS